MYPKAYYDYLIYFHAYRDYFECHEVLEEHWKEKSRGKRETYWVGLIQIAVGLYHERRNNMTGAKRMFTSALNIIEAERTQLQKLGLHTPKLVSMLDNRIKEIDKEGHLFSDMNLPIIDETLLTECQKHCSELGVIWGSESDFRNEHLIHKHKKRDRSEVIEEREQQIKVRKMHKKK